MKISRNWLLDYIDVGDLSASDFRELLSVRVAEVDDVIEIAAPLSDAIVGAVTKVQPHPKRAHLKVATVQTGKGEVEVVCGAPNCEVGILAAYVPPGGKVVTSQEEHQELGEVASREMGGVMSAGMLVSEKELGLTADHGGVLVFEKGIKPGTKVSEVIGGPDLVVVIDNKAITHRPDLWSHYGFVRELSAILRRDRKRNLDEWADAEGSGKKYAFPVEGDCQFRLEISPESECRRFLGVELRGIRNDTSPLWMRRRLASVGAGIRNILVDLSNYVMWDVGQPNHAYDAQRLSGKKITIRNAKAGEKFNGLDGVSRTLQATDVVVADDRHAACLGGILGGAETAIDESTTHLFLEAANWDPGRIRLTGKHHQVRTDASNRFEKNQSPFLTRVGIERFCEILRALQPKVTFSSVGDTFPLRPAAVSVPVRYTYVSERLGAVVPKKQIEQIFTDLGFGVKDTNGGASADVAVPYYRATRDISIAEDLVEEVGRVFGYNELPSTAPLIASDTEIHDWVRSFEYEIRDQLAGMGLAEAYAYSFLDRKRGAELGFALGDAVELANPIDAERDIMRVSIVPAMIELIERNLRYTPSLLMFELGRTYHSDGTNAPHKGRGGAPARERRLLSLGLVAGEDEKNLAALGRPQVEQGLEFYALVGAVRKIVSLAGPEEVRLTPAAVREDAPSAGDEYGLVKKWMHPYRQATIVVGSEPVGVIAEVRPGAADIGGTRAVIAEIDIGRLLQANCAQRPYTALPKFPSSFFEMSVVTPERTPFAEVDRLIRGAVDKKLLKGMEVTAVYRGAPLAAGEKSTSVRLSLGSDERTLGPAEIQELQGQLMKGVEKRFALRR